MKIIKRDGRIVDYDRSKIEIAIEKANKEVLENEQATKKEIDGIIEYIEKLGKKRILVEDIQDIIEEKLMELNKYKLAKRYIVYRYTRALVRKSNTTDETILGLIRNENKENNESSKDTMLASTQRDYIAGEVSKDLTRRLLLPEKIVSAHDDGILYFHNAGYFLQPIIDWSVVNIKDMLDNGTVINGMPIESPKSFQVACTVLTQIIASVASNQYGKIYIDMICLGKYLRKSCDKYENQLTNDYENKIPEEIIKKILKKTINEELKSGIQTIQYQINTLMTTNGHSPNVILYLHLEKDDKYLKENEIIMKEILKQKSINIKNEKGECYSIKFPEIITEKIDLKSKFNQGVVSINLAQIGIIADGDKNQFWKLLEERLELCKEALMCRHYSLLGTKANTSPIHWQYGAISRLNKNEKIDNLLYGDDSELTLGYVGLYEATLIMTKNENTEISKKEFQFKLLKILKEKTIQWKKENNIKFSLESNPEENVFSKFAQIDKEKFGIIKNITDKEKYEN